jgi:hypothetical protein
MEKRNELHRKICKILVSGKMQFTQHMDIRMTTKNLELSIELEEYEAAKIFKEHLDKLKNT